LKNYLPFPIYGKFFILDLLS